MDQLEQKNTTAVEHEYGASEIQVLEGLEAVRKRPGMYIGSTSSSGLHHLVYEIVDNAIDEALAGYCTEIQVGIEPGNIIRVVDNGRGIPVDIQKQTGKPALEVVFTILHAGGKFGGGGYKVSGGLHGVGASVVNALSQWLEVRVHKDGQIYEMKFARGQVTQPMQVVGQTDRTGTEVVFQPDPEMFTETTEYDYETLHTRMREEAFLNAGLSITIADRRGEEVISETMCYEGGIREFVTYINRNKTPIHDGVIYMAGTPGSRPFSPCGAKCSTWKRPGLTGSMAMTSSAPSSPLWGRVSGRSLTRKNSATTKLSSWPTPTWTGPTFGPCC